MGSARAGEALSAWGERAKGTAEGRSLAGDGPIDAMERLSVRSERDKDESEPRSRGFFVDEEKLFVDMPRSERAK